MLQIQYHQSWLLLIFIERFFFCSVPLTNQFYQIIKILVSPVTNSPLLSHYLLLLLIILIFLILFYSLRIEFKWGEKIKNINAPLSLRRR